MVETEVGEIGESVQGLDGGDEVVTEIQFPQLYTLVERVHFSDLVVVQIQLDQIGQLSQPEHVYQSIVRQTQTLQIHQFLYLQIPTVFEHHQLLFSQHQVHHLS